MNNEKPSYVQYFPLVLFIVVASIIASSWVFLDFDKDSEASVKGVQYEGEVSNEMKDFLSIINGSRETVFDALSKYGVEDLYTANMELYNLSNPKVTGFNAGHGYECYSVDFETGVTVRSYQICWAKNQIHSVRFIEVR